MSEFGRFLFFTAVLADGISFIGIITSAATGSNLFVCFLVSFVLITMFIVLYIGYMVVPVIKYMIDYFGFNKLNK